MIRAPDAQEIYKIQKQKKENIKFKKLRTDDKQTRCPALEPTALVRGGDINLAHNGSLTRALRDIYPLNVTLGQSKVICMSMLIF